MNNKTKWFFISLLALLLISTLVKALPAGPTISYIANSTAIIVSPNRTQDAKGTITTVLMDLNQQDFKWKAYVGNVTGKLALDDANAKSIYDWQTGSPTGEVYATRSSSINWNGIVCASQINIDNEQTAMGMAPSLVDNLNSTFYSTTHRSFLVGVTNITQSSCRSTATYINDASQGAMSVNSFFQEVLLNDGAPSNIIYTTMITAAHTGYNGLPYDFQLIVGENESSAVPTTYFFYVELG